jgi:myo-inositol-1(or 4)-monophosphatase
MGVFVPLEPSQTDLSLSSNLARIGSVLTRVAELIAATDLPGVEVRFSSNGDPVTDLDRKINDLIRVSLPNEGEGWLSEESSDCLLRLDCKRVWVVDPIDGTREFVEGIPEWCVSIGLVEDHRAVAGGVLNPSSGELFLGSIDSGLQIFQPRILAGNFRNPELLVSRREHREGKWRTFEPTLNIVPVGSIAYRLAQVAAGYADATCTFQPRHEWDIAAGVALVTSGGGTVQSITGRPIVFNQSTAEVEPFYALNRRCTRPLTEILGVKQAA